MEAQKMSGQTADLAADGIAKLRALFPDCVNAQGEVDFEALRTRVGAQSPEEDKSIYRLSWNGKETARAAALAPSMGTLRPVREKSVDFDTTRNLYVEGDNLETLKLLRGPYAGRVKMIYIDPPYNTGKDFVYHDDYREPVERYRRLVGLAADDGTALSTNSDSSGRFHTNWLNMIYPRLLLARELLSDDGVIFISIDDNEVANLRKVCDEVFGADCFVAELIWKSKSGGANDAKFMAVDHEYVLCYAKNIQAVSFHKDKDATVTTSYNQHDENGDFALERLDKQSIRYSESLDYEIVGPDGCSYFPKHRDPKRPNATWRWSKENVIKRMNELVFKDGCVYTKNYKKEGAIARSLLLEDRFGRTRTGKTECMELMDGEVFSNPKPSKLIYYFSSITTDKDSIILDFFSGSATTAHAVMQLNAEDGGKRKFVLVQLPEPCPADSAAAKAGYKTICEIGEERIRRAGKKVLEEWKEAHPGEKDAPDVGFKVLTLDSSCVVPWNPDPGALGDLLKQKDNILADRSEEDLLFEVLLKKNVPPDLPVERVEVEVAGGLSERGLREAAGEPPALPEKVAVYVADGGALYICLALRIPAEAAAAMLKLREARAPGKPAQFVFREAGFSDLSKTNALAILEQGGVDANQVWTI